MKENQILKQFFGVEFPHDFFQFWNFVQELSKHSNSLLKSPLHIQLGNVFQVFQSNPGQEDIPLSLDSRFYKDPPEFITVLLGDTDGLHWGYYLDDPQASDFLVAYYYHNDAFQIDIGGSNLFAAVKNYLDDVYRTIEGYAQSDLAYSETYHQNLGALDELKSILLNYDHKGETKRVVTAQTRDGIGIVVPTEQYRPLCEDDKFQQWDYVPGYEEVQTYQEKAFQLLAKGYPGTALKLGKDLWDYPDYFEVSFALLEKAYQALNRPVLQNLLIKAKQFRGKARISRNV